MPFNLPIPRHLVVYTLHVMSLTLLTSCTSCHLPCPYPACHLPCPYPACHLPCPYPACHLPCPYPACHLPCLPLHTMSLTLPTSCMPWHLPCPHPAYHDTYLAHILHAMTLTLPTSCISWHLPCPHPAYHDTYLAYPCILWHLPCPHPACLEAASAVTECDVSAPHEVECHHPCQGCSGYSPLAPGAEIQRLHRIYLHCPVVTEESTNPSVKLTKFMQRFAEAWPS